ncbi:peptide/nickel transport system substrate-binding protein [Rhizobium sp. BK529]|uniref:ABC transporter substrate-binding protein n=1 Tax=Rhizobium sp. BK529 TaxID=2586983 RepID=UPI00160CFED1|nr:ABC transporter substrate-binding protein [Rhizobium sp. BK529]MBB3593336.1 peptide/nickel transport system substrate-binding protein [Rhizobium sp. BK529]
MSSSRREFLVQSGLAVTTAAVASTIGLGRARAGDMDTISIALASRAPVGLNPQQTGLNGGDNWAVNQLFDTLVKPPEGRWAVKPDEFLPSIAESWESSADAKTWTYKIRKGVKFHKNYGEVTADDVVFTFQRQLDPKQVTANKVIYANIASCEAVDPMTVRFTLKSPDPLFNGSCASTLSVSILSKKAFEEKGERFNTDAIGTGPYQLQTFDANDGLLLTAFPEHFDGPPATPNLRITFIADTTARTLAFAAGQVDMIEGVRAPGWIETMKQRSADTIFDATAPGSHNTLNINLTRKPLDNLKVRQAIRYGIDNAAIAAAFQGIASPMVGIIASQFAGSVKVADLPVELQYKPDPAKAKALLAEAGFPNGVTIPCYVSQREDYASIMLMIQEQLRTSGITLDLKIIDHTTFHSDNRQDKNALALYSSSFPPVPTLTLASQLAASAEVKTDGKGGGNYSHYGVAIPGIDDLLAKAQNEPDFDKRIALIQEAEKKVLTDLPLLGVIALSYVIARNPRVDIGYKVESGPAYWSLAKAKRVG